MSKMRLGIIVGVAMLAVDLAGCSERLVGIGPDTTQAQRDEAQQQTTRPQIEHDVDFEVVTVEADVAVPHDRFATWFAARGAAMFCLLPIDSDTANAEPQSVTLAGAQMASGERRRLLLGEDTALVEVISHQPDRLEYEVWNLTTYFGRYITYAVGNLTFAPGPQGTHIRWTFSFRPLAGPDGWLIRPYIGGTFRQSMSTALAALSARASAELAP